MSASSSLKAYEVIPKVPSLVQLTSDPLQHEAWRCPFRVLPTHSHDIDPGMQHCAKSMDESPALDGFSIISTIRSDVILLNSHENTLINSNINSTLARSPVQFYMLSLHQRRMLASAKAFGWDPSPLEGPEGFAKLLDLLHEHLEKVHKDRIYNAPLRLRISYSVGGTFTISSNGPHPGPATINRVLSPPRNDTVSQLYPGSLFDIADPVLGAPYLRWRLYVAFDSVTPTLFTRHKTTDRRQYERAMTVLPASLPDLIVNDIKLQSEVLIVNDCQEIMEGCIFTPYFLRESKWITPSVKCGGNVGTTRHWALELGLCEEGVVDRDSVKEGEIVVLSNGVRGFQSGVVQPFRVVKD